MKKQVIAMSTMLLVGNSATDTTHTTESEGFYRIEVEMK
ncbi:hypothetical protein SCARR_01984 [Pontiella sulfatireligans]|uniref:Uncharacterized protein n=1 Tax=Pontiella sulfatireligans TaxID=2750658 RepID=A0A6C2UKU8_9BACT|nr:hypothetical protein SCARR_01984 [Pontiella sulfatireligans]